MIKGVHTMFYSSEPEALREFLRDKLGFDSYTDVGGGWLIFDLPGHGCASHRPLGEARQSGRYPRHFLLLRRHPDHGYGTEGPGCGVRRRSDMPGLRTRHVFSDAGQRAGTALPALLT